MKDFLALAFFVAVPAVVGVFFGLAVR